MTAAMVRSFTFETPSALKCEREASNTRMARRRGGGPYHGNNRAHDGWEIDSRRSRLRGRGTTSTCT